jgi:hypothetical protein
VRAGKQRSIEVVRMMITDAGRLALGWRLAGVRRPILLRKELHISGNEGEPARAGRTIGQRDHWAPPVGRSAKALLTRLRLWQCEPLGLSQPNIRLRSRAFAGPILKAYRQSSEFVVPFMSKFEIELLSKNGTSVIGVANDAESALNVMDEAMRQYPTGHIRVRCGATVFAERMPPRAVPS